MAVYQQNLNYKNGWWAKFDPHALVCWSLKQSYPEFDADI